MAGSSLRYSGANVGRYLGIVLDGEVMSAPVLLDRIGSQGQIEMTPGTPLEEAADLALVLRAGALPTRVNIIEEQTVGPSSDRTRSSRVRWPASSASCSWS